MVGFDDLKSSAESASKKGLHRLWTFIAAHPRPTAVVLLVSVVLNVVLLLSR